MWKFEEIEDWKFKDARSYFQNLVSDSPEESSLQRYKYQISVETVKAVRCMK